MSYVLAPGGVVERYPYTLTDLRLSRPDVSWPLNVSDETAASFGVYRVTVEPQPAFDARTERLEPQAPAFVGGVWMQGWAVRSATPDELQQAAQQLQYSIVQATQARLDDFARTRNYDGILSAATYATSTVPKFQAEGQYAVNARDQTWATLYEILAEVQAGTRPAPTGYSDIEPDLPVLTWPN